MEYFESQNPDVPLSIYIMDFGIIAFYDDGQSYFKFNELNELIDSLKGVKANGIKLCRPSDYTLMNMKLYDEYHDIIYNTCKKLMDNTKSIYYSIKYLRSEDIANLVLSLDPDIANVIYDKDENK